MKTPCKQCGGNADQAADYVERLERKLHAIKLVVDAQAKDAGLWFDAESAPESYLQQALRRLHTETELRL